MAIGEEINSTEDDDAKSIDSESTNEVNFESISDFSEHLESLMVRVLETENQLKNKKKTVKSLEGKLQNERDLFLKLSIEKAETGDEFTYLQKCLNKMKEENEELHSKISALTAKRKSLDVENSENELKYKMIYDEQADLYAKIKDLEDKFLKRGQTDQTIHMNKPK